MVMEATNPQTLTLSDMAKIVETAEANMFDGTFGALSPDIAAEYGMACQEIGGGSAVFFEQLPIFLFNRAIGLGIHQPATEGMIDELTQLYGRRQLPFGVTVSPAAQPSQLSEWLLERGFKRADNWAKMIRGPEPLPHIETDLRVEPVTKANAAQFGEVAQKGFGMPGWFVPIMAKIALLPNVYCYVAYDGDVPVAVGSMHVSNGVGSLFNGTTLPEYRRRGGQSAIMARRIQDGIGMGCHWFSTETGEETPEAPNSSYHNMLRTGFQLAYLRPTYVCEPNTAVSGL